MASQHLQILVVSRATRKLTHYRFVGRGFSHDISLQLSAALAAEGPILQFPHIAAVWRQWLKSLFNLWMENYRTLRPGA